MACWLNVLKDLLVLVGVVLSAVAVVGGSNQHRQQQHPREEDPPSRIIAGYLPDYRFYIDVNATAPFLTDLYLFSAAPAAAALADDHSSNQDTTGNDVLSSCCLDRDKFETARQARAYKAETTQQTTATTAGGSNSNHSQLKLWLTVGGGGRSDHFLENLDGLADAIVKVAAEQGLDGIDLDCEAFRSQEEYDRYLAWIRTAAAPGFREAGLLVSVALHADQFLPPDLYGLVDRVNLMAYDLAGHAYHGDFAAVKAAAEKLLQSGCPASKVLLGVPAYARHATNPGDVRSYAELVDEKEKTTDEGLDSELDAFGSWNGYRGESPRTVREKVEYARSRGLAGVFFWELGQDKQHSRAPGGILLESAAGKVFGGGDSSSPQDDEL